MRPMFQWQLAHRTLALGEKTIVMGVLNATPDSFSDGGRYLEPGRAIEHGLRLLDDGAGILDIGGESTRPGSGQQPVTAAEEQDRVLPVIEGILRERSQAIISVDTYKSSTASAALAAGAEIVNDVSGAQWDPAMLPTLAATPSGAILMHTRGRPDEWPTQPPLDDPLDTTLHGLEQVAAAALAIGIERERIVLDPGFGFGKRLDQNYPLFAHFAEFASLGYPLLSAPSRKSFLARTVAERLGCTDASSLPVFSLLHATLAAVTASVLAGAHIVRVHDVRPTVEAVAIADAILRAK